MKKFLKQLFCEHELEVVQHFKGEFTPFSLVECKHCGKRDKIDDYEGQNWYDDNLSVIHPIIKSWSKGSASIKEVSEALK